LPSPSLLQVLSPSLQGIHQQQEYVPSPQPRTPQPAPSLSLFASLRQDSPEAAAVRQQARAAVYSSSSDAARGGDAQFRRDDPALRAGSAPPEVARIKRALTDQVQNLLKEDGEPFKEMRRGAFFFHEDVADFMDTLNFALAPALVSGLYEPDWFYFLRITAMCYHYPLTLLPMIVLFTSKRGEGLAASREARTEGWLPALEASKRAVSIKNKKNSVKLWRVRGSRGSGTMNTSSIKNPFSGEAMRSFYQNVHAAWLVYFTRTIEFATNPEPIRKFLLSFVDLVEMVWAVHVVPLVRCLSWGKDSPAPNMVDMSLVPVLFCTTMWYLPAVGSMQHSGNNFSIEQGSEAHLRFVRMFEAMDTDVFDGVWRAFVKEVHTEGQQAFASTLSTLGTVLRIMMRIAAANRCNISSAASYEPEMYPRPDAYNLPREIDLPTPRAVPPWDAGSLRAMMEKFMQDNAVDKLTASTTDITDEMYHAAGTLYHITSRLCLIPPPAVLRVVSNPTVPLHVSGFKTAFPRPAGTANDLFGLNAALPVFRDIYSRVQRSLSVVMPDPDRRALSEWPAFEFINLIMTSVSGTARLVQSPVPMAPPAPQAHIVIQQDGTEELAILDALSAAEAVLSQYADHRLGSPVPLTQRKTGSELLSYLIAEATAPAGSHILKNYNAGLVVPTADIQKHRASLDVLASSAGVLSDNSVLLLLFESDQQFDGAGASVVEILRSDINKPNHPGSGDVALKKIRQNLSDYSYADIVFVTRLVLYTTTAEFAKFKGTADEKKKRDSLKIVFLNKMVTCVSLLDERSRLYMKQPHADYTFASGMTEKSSYVFAASTHAEFAKTRGRGDGIVKQAFDLIGRRQLGKPRTVRLPQSPTARP
jgi:hypothetical protein